MRYVNIQLQLQTKPTFSKMEHDSTPTGSSSGVGLHNLSISQRNHSRFRIIIVPPINLEHLTCLLLMKADHSGRAV
jgi:hypothetical protein